MTAAWNWVKRWGWVALVVVGAVLAVIFRRKTLPGTNVDATIAAARADAEAERVIAAKGHEEAIKAVEEKYAAVKTALEEKERAEAEELRADPRALARFLAAAGSRKRTGAGRAR